jgi:predicted Zn-dependent protease
VTLRRPALALLLLLATVQAAPAAEPIEAAQPGQRPVAGSDEDELWYAMDRAERELQQSPQLVRDPALNAYVRGVACKVSGDYCKDMRVYLVDLPYFNAMMAPNGMMVVWTGTLLRAQNEAELALVLSHEFAHFRERHTLQAWRKAKRTTAFLATFGVLTYGGGVGLVGQIAGLAGAASLLQFSRASEREADHLGFATAVAQGYEPEAGVHLWERMVREEEARHYGKIVPVFASHPRSRERLEDVRTAAAAARAEGHAGTVTGRDAYHAATRGFLYEWLENELSRRMYDTSIQVLADLRPLADGEEQATYAFFQGEALRRRGHPGDHEAADAKYAEAIALPGAPSAAWREHGLALRATGHPAEATIALHRYLELEPTAQDAAFIRRYLAELESTK